MSKYFDKGKILIGESWAVMPSSLYKEVRLMEYVYIMMYIIIIVKK